MRNIKIVFFSLVLVGIFCFNVFAHYALEYIETESYETGKKGEGLFHLHYDYMVDDGKNTNLDHYEITPGFAYGITDCLMFDIHTHFAKFGTGHILASEKAKYEPVGPSPFMEAVAMTLQYQLTENQPVNFAVSSTLELPFQQAKDLLGSENNVAKLALIMGYDFFEHANLTLNLLYEKEGEEDSTGYAVGAKTPLSSDPHGIAGGVEILGNFDGSRFSVLPGIYLPLTEGMIMKTGLEFGKTNEDDSEADTLRASMILMYVF